MMQMGNDRTKLLGVYLVEAGILTQTQVETALNEQHKTKKRLGEILVARGWIEQKTIDYLMEKVILPERTAVDERSRYLKKNGNGNQKVSASGQPSPTMAQDTDSLQMLALPSRELEIYLSPKRTIRLLLLVVFSLILVSIAVQFSVYYLPDYHLRDAFLTPLFTVDNEQNIPSVYSWSALVFCSILLAIIAYAKKLAGERYANHWLALSIIFLYLSLDEAASIHEKLIIPLQAKFNASGFLYYAWVVPGAIFAIACLLAFVKFIAALPAKTRRLVLMAGTTYIGGAIGMELVGGYHADFYGQQNLAYAIITTIEELLEMLGIVIFIYALLSYISSNMKGLSLRINVIGDRNKRYNN